MCAAIAGLDAGALGHALQGAVLVFDAHAACHAAVFGQGVLQQVADHAVAVEIIIGVGGQVIVHHLKSLRAVVVVRIDDRKGAVDQGLCSQHGMAGAPRLYTAFRHGKACGQLFQLLKSVLHVHCFRHAVADGSFEGVLDLVLNDKDHGLKAGAAGVIERIVHNDLSVGAHRVDLLHAAVAAAHAGCHDDQYRFVHLHFLLYLPGVPALYRSSPIIHSFAACGKVQRGERFYTFLPLSLDFFVPACYNQRSFILSKTLMRTN